MIDVGRRRVSPAGSACGQVGLVSRRWLCLAGRVGGEGNKDQAAPHPEGRRRIAIEAVASRTPGEMSAVASWSESFIFAGGSSFLLLLAVLFPAYWYVSFFALAPFLYRIVRAAPNECLRLGIIFGLSFFVVSGIDSLMISPAAFLLRLLSGTALFGLFAWTMGWVRKRWGFNPFILVFLWVGLELGLVKLGFVGGLLGEARLSHHFIGSLVTLFGFLAVSAIIVLLNSLLVLTIVNTLRERRPRRRTVQEDERLLGFFSAAQPLGQRVYLVPEGRAPPIEAVPVD